MQQLLGGLESHGRRWVSLLESHPVASHNGQFFSVGPPMHLLFVSRVPLAIPKEQEYGLRPVEVRFLHGKGSMQGRSQPQPIVQQEGR